MTSYYVDPDYEPAEHEDEPYTPAQPSDFCECRPGVPTRHGWQHAPECLRWMPPLTGSGSTDDHRAKAMAHIKAQIAAAKEKRNAGYGGQR